MSTARISLPDRYRVVRHIANGGMASVWEAHDELLDRAVAVKLLASHLSEDDRARQRFQREARAAAAVSSHPNVVTIYDVGEHDGKTFMVMELLKGGTVADKLRAGDRISPRTAMRWLRDAASALDAAHAADVVHRDVKPANMLLDDAGRLAIADFGIARLALEDQLTATGTVLGTAAYISPEQAVGDPATAASDRYALAVVAYELLTGARPFEAENFAAQARAHVEDDPEPASVRNPDLPAEVDAVLARGLEKDPGARYASAGELVDHLDDAISAPDPGHPATADHAQHPLMGGGPPPRTAPPVAAGNGRPAPRRRNAGVLLAALATAALVAVIAVLLLSGGDGGDGNKQQAESTPQRTETPTQRPRSPRTPPPRSRPPRRRPPRRRRTPPRPPARSTSTRPASCRWRATTRAWRATTRKSLDLSQQAIDACGNSNELDPCGYALFEKGLALNRSGKPDEAIPVLEERLDRFGDNEKGEVAKELKAAKKAAG